MANKSKISYCGELLRSHESDRFLISMFAPMAVREDIWALFAFNHEIAKTREVVSDTTLGLMRLQWWRDSIAGIYEGSEVVGNEVLKPLAIAIKQHNLPREHFDALIYAREFDLEDVAPANVEGLMNYTDFTTTPILKLALQICDVDPDLEVVQPIAINFALAGILRSIPQFAQQNRLLLPDDLKGKYGVTNDNIFEESSKAGLQNIARDIVACRLPKSHPDNTILKAYTAFSDIYFKQIISLDYDIMSPLLQREPAFKALRLFWKTKIL